jgi:hypothetical protein
MLGMAGERDRGLLSLIEGAQSRPRRRSDQFSRRPNPAPQSLCGSLLICTKYCNFFIAGSRAEIVS